MTYRDDAPLLSLYGLVAFPLGGDNGKKPLVANWHKLRLSVPTSVVSFSTANTAIAMRQSNLTVVDVDDHNAMPECLDRFGDSPVKVQTHRGYHLYYRANSERGMKLKPEIVADLKTGNAYVVAPDSIHVETGTIYTWIEGGPEQLEPSNDRLPTIKPGALEALARSRQGSKQDAASEHHRESRGNVPEGHRTDAIFAHLRSHAHGCGGSLDALMDEGRNWNKIHADPPLTDDEVVRQVNGVKKLWDEGRCYAPGQGRESYEIYQGNSNAMMLHRVLMVFHSRRIEPFAVSPSAMQASSVIQGWGKDKYRRARDHLLTIGLLKQIHQGHARGDPSLFVWP